MILLKIACKNVHWLNQIVYFKITKTLAMWYLLKSRYKINKNIFSKIHRANLF